MNSNNSKKRTRFHFKFKFLLVWLLLYFLISPFLNAAPHTDVAVQFLFSIVLFAAVYTIHQESRIISLPGFTLLAIVTVILWSRTFRLMHINEIAINAVLVTYLLLLVLAFSRYIFHARKIDSELIAAALCLYILLGLLWASALMLLEEIHPGSFSGIKNGIPFREQFEYFHYFSFVTLTTLGYGDITPQTPAAMAFCHIEAIIGQFFTAVLVARLVGIQVAQSFTRDAE